MASKTNTLRIQVPAYRPASPLAGTIGEFFAQVLLQVRAVGVALTGVLEATRPNTIRAELIRSAADVEASRPSTALSLRSVAAKGWVH